MSNKAATIQDVARVAGVSTATVSRTLSNPDKVSEKTRALVQAAVQKTGYRVNRAARNLRTQKAHSVLVLLPDLANPFFSIILEGISSVLAKHGQTMLITGTKQLQASGDTLASYFHDGRADGLIILDGSLDRSTLDTLEALPESKCIVFACEWVPDANFPSVRSRNRDGTANAIRHLYDLGHRKIGHVTGPESNVLSQVRKETAVSEMSKLGIAPRADWIFPGDFSLQAGQRAAQAWLAMRDRPTALFCASDLLAFAAISEFTRNGINVPEDISVMGFDDIELASQFNPPLTTIRQDRFMLGETAANILMQRIAGEAEAERQTIATVPVELVARKSTAQVS